MKTTQRATLTIQENLARKNIFIDGFARTAKSLLSSIVPSLKGVEHVQFYSMVEYIVQAVSLSVLDVRVAKALLRMNMNELAYHMRLSRGINFRPEDQSGIPNYHDPKLYKDRLSRSEGDGVIGELRRADRFTPYQTHDLLPILDALNKLEVDYYLLEMTRHPVDTIYSAWRKGWGERWGVDPKAWNMTLEHEGQQVPWHSHGREEEWLRLNPLERCTQSILDLFRRAVHQYQITPSKERILIVTVEDFIQDPEPSLEKICHFLDTEPTDKTAYYIKKACCPRVLDPADRARKLGVIKEQVNPALLDDLMKMSNAYEQNLFGLKG